MESKEDLPPIRGRSPPLGYASLIVRYCYRLQLVTETILRARFRGKTGKLIFHPIRIEGALALLVLERVDGITNHEPQTFTSFPLVLSSKQSQ